MVGRRRPQKYPSADDRELVHKSGVAQLTTVSIRLVRWPWGSAFPVLWLLQLSTTITKIASSKYATGRTEEKTIMR